MPGYARPRTAVSTAVLIFAVLMQARAQSYWYQTSYTINLTEPSSVTNLLVQESPTGCCAARMNYLGASMGIASGSQSTVLVNPFYNTSGTPATITVGIGIVENLPGDTVAGTQHIVFLMSGAAAEVALGADWTSVLPDQDESQLITEVQLATSGGSGWGNSFATLDPGLIYVTNFLTGLAAPQGLLGLGSTFTTPFFAVPAPGAAPDACQVVAFSTGQVIGTCSVSQTAILVSSGPPIPTYEGSVLNGNSNSGVTGPQPCSAGDPVICVTGNLVETHADLVVPGRGRMLNLVRTFNGLDAASESSPDPMGFGWTHTYSAFVSFDSYGDPTVHQGNGSTVPFLNSGGAVFTPPSFVIATFVQNPNGTYTFTLPNQWAEIFNASGVLLAETDRNGYMTTLTYNSSGQLTSVTDPAGRSLIFHYGGNGLVSSVIDPMGRTVTYGYDGSMNLASVTDPAGNITRFAYDSSHHLIRVTDPNGGIATNVYDSSNRVVSQTDPAGRTMTFVYGTGTTTVTDGDGHVTLQTYTNNQLTALTRGVGSPQAATWTFTYDGSGNRISGTDPNGHTWNATYDAHGNMLTYSDPLGRTTTSTYDTLNDPLTRTDPLGVTTTYTYTARGDLAKVSRPLTTSQTWTVNFVYGDPSHPGDVTAIVDANGQTWSQAYDANGDLIRRVDPDGDISTASYNGIGWLTSAVMPRGNANGANPADYSVTLLYTILGQLLQSTDQLGHVTKYTYDPDHNLITFTNANGQLTRYTYDPDNERIKTTRADGTVLLTSFDAAGNMIGQTDGLGRTTSYSYDAQNRPFAMTDPLGRITQYLYDGAGNPIATIDAANEKTSLSYDAANQLIAIAYSDGVTPPVTYSYDLDGQRIGMTDGTGASTYQIDSLHRVTMTTDGAGNRVSYSYDLRGDLTGLTYPSGKQVTRGFDPAGRLISVADWLGNKSTFSYDPDGDLITTQYGNGRTSAFGYDRTDLVTSMNYQFLNFNYVRDNLGQVINFNSAGLAGDETYSYTPINEVSQAGPESFAYDPADNILRMSFEGFNYDVANELIHENPGPAGNLTYDARGNRVQAAGLSYRYDQANRLTGYGFSASYAYNGDGLRMRKVMNGAPSNYVWQLGRRLLMDGATQFIYGPGGMPLEQVNPDGGVYWFHQDQLGSTRALSDRNGNIVARYGYSAYGVRPGIDPGDNFGPALTPLLFAGQYTDSESGLQYLRARYYDPQTGQFLTRDPASPMTRTPYLYAGGNPLNYRDPAGLIPDPSDDDDDEDNGSGPPSLNSMLNMTTTTDSGGASNETPPPGPSIVCPYPPASVMMDPSTGVVPPNPTNKIRVETPTGLSVVYDVNAFNQLYNPVGTANAQFAQEMAEANRTADLVFFPFLLIKAIFEAQPSPPPIPRVAPPM